VNAFGYQLLSLKERNVRSMKESVYYRNLSLYPHKVADKKAEEVEEEEDKEKEEVEIEEEEDKEEEEVMVVDVILEDQFSLQK
jgi:hypothetical protein